MPALFVFMIAPIRPVLAQANIEGHWDDRFARDIYGGLSVRAEEIVTQPETGDVYVGGNFSRYGDIDLNYLARWTGDGWEPVGQGTNGRVVAIAFAPNGDMAVGGTFTEVYQTDGTPLAAQRVARWDGAQWHALGGGIASTVEVIAALPSGDIVVGGNFDSAEDPGGQVVDVENIAVWNGSQWGSLGGGLNNTVRALAVHPPTGDLIAGGSFAEAYNSDGSTVAARSVARWTGSEWQDLGGGFSGGLDDLAIGSDGTIYAAGSGAPGLIGGFDGSTWTTLGGGIPGIYARAVAFGNNKVFVGGQFQDVANSDGSRLRSPNIAAYDLDAGEWISLDPGTSNTVSTLSYDGSAVFIGGGFDWAGPFPAQFISRWIDSPPAYPAAPVTFRVDVRRLESFGFLPLSRSVMLDVFDGANAKRFGMFDPDGDGVHSVRVPQPIGGTIRYAFFIDIDRDGFEGDNTWVFERDVTTNPRRLSIQSVDPVVLPIVHFDDLPPVPFASDFEASNGHPVKPGSLFPIPFFAFPDQREATIDIEQLDRTIRLAAFWYASDPGGTAPEEIENVAQSTYWRFETTPLAAAFSASVFLEFVPGVSAPEDVRVLYRPSPDSVWQVMESEVDPGGEGMVAHDVTRLSGEWTLGSVSRFNSLTDDPPGLVSDPRPVDGTLNAPLTPTLTWEHADGAERYNVYIWPSGEMEPSSPTAQNLDQPLYHATGLTGSAGAESFNWRVVARNINGETPGPVWSLEIGPAADLAVGDVAAPSTGFSGQQIEVTWTVENAGGGGTSVPAWHDEVFLSDAPTFDASAATSLGRARNVSYLNPGESYSSRATVDLPQGIQGTFYVHVVADASRRGGGEIAEPDEENNVSEGAALEVTLTPFADLQVTNIVAPDNAFSGDEIDISWTVQNEGSGQTDVPDWFDSIFLSEDAELDFNFAPQGGLTTIRINDPELASTEHSGPLEAGESYTANLRVTLPDDAIGDFYLIVYADIRGGVKQPERGDVYEFNQELNNWASDSIRITLTPPPDLVVTGVEAPAGALSGQPVELSWTVTNAGPGATRAETWNDLVYYSPSPVFDAATAVLLGSFQHTGVLSNDASYTAIETVRVPDGADGERYFFVHTNSDGTVFEHTFDANNVGGSTEPSTVTRAPYPDLVIPAISVSPSVATAGQQVAVSYELANNGTAVADSWTDHVYVHSSPEWKPEEAFLVGTISQQMALSPDASRAHSTSVTLPPELDGSYYVYVWADAEDVLFEFPDSQGNIFRSAAYTAGAYPPVDLRAEIVAAPATVSSGSSTELEIRVRNIGRGRTTVEGWTDELYLSEDSGLDPESDILLDRVIHEGALAGGAEYVLRKHIALPQGLDGEYFFIVRTDADGSVADADASNNISTAPVDIILSPTVDLQVTVIDAPATIAAAEAVTVSWIVANEGQGQAEVDGGRWFDAVYLSEDEKLDRRDVLLGTRERTAALPAGESYQASLVVSLPAYNSGRYFLLVQADQRDDVYEHGTEFNNTASLRVDLTLSPPADLTVQDVIAPAQAIPGEPVTIEWTLVNQGDNPARGRMREAVFISEDATWDPDDRLLGVAEIDIDLASGASTQAAMKVDVSRTYKADGSGNISGEMPGVVPGVYYAIVRTDIANNIRETDDDNNAMSSTSTTTADVQVLELDVPEIQTMSAGRSRLFRLNIDEGRDLRLTLTSDVETAGNEIYVAYERPPSAGGDFDFSASEPFSADQQMVVPSTSAGTYYVLLLSRTVPEPGGTQNLSILAEALDFSITSITPAVGGQGQVTTMLHGAGLRNTDVIYLANDNFGRFDASAVEFNNTTESKIKWRLESVPTATYDVVVQRQNGDIISLDDGFEVEAASSLLSQVRISGPDRIRAEGTATYMLSVTNISNVDIPYLHVPIISTRTNDVQIDTDLLTLDQLVPTDLPRSIVQNYILSDQETMFIPIIGKDVEAGSTESVSLEFSGFYLSSFEFTARGIPMDENQMMEAVTSGADDARREILVTKKYDDRLTGLANDPTRFRHTMIFNLSRQGLLSNDTQFEGSSKMEIETGRANMETSPCVCMSYGSNGCEEFKCWDPDDPPPPAPDPPPPPGGGSPIACDQQLAARRRCVDTAGRFCDFGPTCPVIGLGCGLATANPIFGFTCGLVCVTIKSMGACDPNHPNSIPNSLGPLICPPVDASCDPNDIIGPAGFSAEKWIARDETLPYTIRFENDPQRASASAQVVGITHPLDPTVDPRRFRLGSFGFGSFTFEPPENVSYHQTRLDVVDSLGVYVDVSAGIDVLSNQAFWAFKSIDPATGDQPSNDPLAGFLPINDASKGGEGFATYTIRPAEDAATGDVIDAQASIVFDINAPIDTPPVFNTVDATAPVSSVGVQPARSDTASFYVFWSGEDEGSGIRNYQLYISRSGEPFEPYQSATADTSLLFAGELGSSYQFFTIATDNVGNVEPMKSTGEAVTVVAVEEDAEPGLPRSYALHQNYPNPFNPQTTIPFDIAEQGDIQIAVYNLLGQRVLLVRQEQMSPGFYQQSLDMSQFASGVYFYEIRVLGEGRIRFRDVKKFILVK